MFKLSPRMQLIYDHLIPGKPVWDFCCDHGYLGLNAYESGQFSEVYFVDQVRHIIEQLKRRFEDQHFDEASKTQAHFLPRAGENITVPVQGTVVIAGVGPHTISKILNNLVEKKLLEADRLILSPHGDDEKLLQIFAENSDFHYRISNQDCKVEERGRMRKVLILHRI